MELKQTHFRSHQVPLSHYKNATEFFLIVDLLRQAQQKITLSPIKTSGPNQQSASITPNLSINWSVLYQLLLRHRVWHQAKNTLHFPNIAAAQQIGEKLTRQCKQSQVRILTMAKEVLFIAQAFNHANIMHCFIKGITLNAKIYKHILSRPCSDIDLWVDLSHFDTAQSLLLSLGYALHEPNYPLHGFKKSYHMTHRHDIAFYHHQKQILVELHFKLDYGSLQYFEQNNAILEPVMLFNTPVMTLKDSYHLLYLMIHGSIHAWLRLRWLHDIVLFIQQGTDLVQIMRLAEQIECVHVVEQTLLLVRDIFKVEHAVMNQLIQEPSQRALALVRLTKKFLASGYQMPDGIKNFSMFLLYRFYLFKLALPQKRIVTLWRDLFKIDKLFPYISLPNQLAWLYYVIYPFWMIRFIFNRST